MNGFVKEVLSNTREIRVPGCLKSVCLLFKLIFVRGCIIYLLVIPCNYIVSVECKVLYDLLSVFSRQALKKERTLFDLCELAPVDKYYRDTVERFKKGLRPYFPFSTSSND